MAAQTIKTREVPDDPALLEHAANVLERGGLVVLPTETVYGVCALLRHADAMRRLRQLRDDQSAKPFVPHLSDSAQAIQFTGPIGELGQRLMRRLWPGPVALVFDVPDEHRRRAATMLNVAESDLYDNGSITLRYPDHAVATGVIARLPAPLVATMAYAPGGEAAHRVDEFDPAVVESADLILEAGPTRYSKPSTILHVGNDAYQIVRAGIYDDRIIERLLRTTILFVCSGNTCRSPMAEALARQVLAQRHQVAPDELDKKGISVMSAGASAMPGARATPQAVTALEAMGADLSRHRSRPLSIELINQADLIFTMGRSHAASVRSLVPSAADKVVSLNPEGDIDDPIGGDIALYQTLANQLRGFVEQRLRERSLV